MKGPTSVKICGITTLADARYCAGAGVDYLGFIQYPPSPRYIDPDEAKGIIEWLYGPSYVGVFVNEPADLVNEIAEHAGFSHVQIHGDHPVEYFEALEKPAIKAFSIYPDTKEDDIERACEQYASHVYAFLMDTGKAGMWGGTGETFDWNIVGPAVAAHRVFLAGGLNPENVGNAIETLHPYGIDLSSGVEAEPGVKDFDLLAALFEAVEASAGP